jgi:hypothetical protein
LLEVLRPINSVGPILGALRSGWFNSALRQLIKMTADLLFGAAELPKSLLNLLDGRRGLYILECVVVLFHVGFACKGKILLKP